MRLTLAGIAACVTRVAALVMMARSLAPAAAVDPDLIAQRAYLWSSGEGEIVSPRIGQSVRLRIAWTTTGSGDTPRVGIRALIDGVLACQGNFPVEFPLDYETECDWTATAGAHALRWELDFRNELAETNESNNTAALNFTTLGPPGTATRTPARTPTPSPSKTPSRTAARTPARTATRTPSRPRSSATPATATPTVVDPGVPPYFFRGDANCSIVVSAADLIATVRGLGGGSLCGNDDCDRDGEVTAADLACAEGCAFYDCPVPPNAPRVIGVFADSAPGAQPFSVARLGVSKVKKPEAVGRVVIGGYDAEIVEVVDASSVLVIVPNVAAGPTSVVVYEGDVAGPAFPATISAPVPVGPPDTFAGTLDLLDDAVARFGELDLDAAYGAEAGTVRARLQELCDDMRERQAALAGDPGFTAEVRALLDAAFDSGGAAEELRELLAELEAGGASAGELGGAADANTIVIGTRIARITRVVAAGLAEAAPVAEGGLLSGLLGVAGVVILIGGLVWAASSPAAPLVSALLFYEAADVSREFPTESGVVRVQGERLDPGSTELQVWFVGRSFGVLKKPVKSGSTFMEFEFPGFGPGLCGAVRLALTTTGGEQLTKPYSTFVQPEMRSGIDPSSAPPFAEFKAPVRGIWGCPAAIHIAEGAYDRSGVYELYRQFPQIAWLPGYGEPQSGGLWFAFGKVPNVLPGNYLAWIQVEDEKGVKVGPPSQEEVPFEVVNGVDALRIVCALTRLVVSPGAPDLTRCWAEPVWKTSIDSEVTDLPEGTETEWTISDPAAVALDPRRTKDYVNVKALRPGTAEISAEAFGFGEVYARTGVPLVLTAVDETAPLLAPAPSCSTCGLRFEPPGMPRVGPGDSVRVRVTGKDNVAVSRLRVRASGDAVANPQQESPCLALTNECSATFRFDIKGAGAFTDSGVTVIAEAYDGSGNKGTSGSLSFTVESEPTPIPTEIPTAIPTAIPTEPVITPSIGVWRRVESAFRTPEHPSYLKVSVSGNTAIYQASVVSFDPENPDHWTLEWTWTDPPPTVKPGTREKIHVDAEVTARGSGGMERWVGIVEQPCGSCADRTEVHLSPFMLTNSTDLTFEIPAGTSSASEARIFVYLNVTALGDNTVATYVYRWSP